MLLSSIVNMFGGKKVKTYGPLEVMGYGRSADGGGRKSQGQSAAETQLRMRLLQSSQRKKGKRGTT